MKIIKYYTLKYVTKNINKNNVLDVKTYNVFKNIFGTTMMVCKSTNLKCFDYRQ